MKTERDKILTGSMAFLKLKISLSRICINQWGFLVFYPLSINKIRVVFVNEGIQYEVEYDYSNIQEAEEDNLKH